MQHKTKATKIFTRKESQANVEKCEVQKIKVFNYCIYYVCIGRQKHVSQGKCWKEGLRKY